MMGLYIFTNDLRTEHNELLQAALQQEQKLIAVFIIDNSWFKTSNYQCQMLGGPRRIFLRDALLDLHQRLLELGVQFKVIYGNSFHALCEQVSDYGIVDIYVSKQIGWYEHNIIQQLKWQFTNVTFHEAWSHTLLRPQDISGIGGIKGSFSRFRKKIEKRNLVQLRQQATSHHGLEDSRNSLLSLDFEQDNKQYLDILSFEELDVEVGCTGGESAAKHHMREYFLSSSPHSYKETRNELDGFTNSSKFSPWLALGNVSVSSIWRSIEEFEHNFGENDSTYWLKFELLWREYFQWYGAENGHRLFKFSGISDKEPLTSFYPQRFRQWCAGNTSSAFVNACMHQLNRTGYMSNRGRQIVASYFVNELQMDWRYGAAYFQQQLIDFDVASNWGNWQYIAGVGPDPRGGRFFNIEKQAQQYDPKGQFVKHWRGSESVMATDANDAVDWPVAETNL